MALKDKKFKKGDVVTTCPEALASHKKSLQLIRRTRLNDDELRKPMHVINVSNEGQLEVKHPDMQRHLVIHQKFMVQTVAV